MDNRLEKINHWLSRELQGVHYKLSPASADASFRRYFRVVMEGQNLIVMDAPPDKEDCGPFITIAKKMREQGLNVPKVLATNLEEGFLLLTDLGCHSYLDKLSGETADQLYRQAIDVIVMMQTKITPKVIRLPAYDQALLSQELSLFLGWYIEGVLKYDLSKGEQAAFQEIDAILIKNALEQPVVFVHRDFHSRNLMVSKGADLGIIDFQDAVMGPVTYDLVSLLKDCYISWPVEKLNRWRDYYYDQASNADLLPNIEKTQFQRWFDLMGMQRHLKAVGIFSRLSLRDGKAGYLQDIPRTLNYMVDVASQYVELGAVAEFLNKTSIRCQIKGQVQATGRSS